MNFFKTIILFFTIVLSSCETKGQNPDNTKPMYGEVIKSEEFIKIDEDFKKESLKQYKTIDSSVYVQINNAWYYFYNKDFKTAMKRFNQAWLLNPEFPDSYFGFAALMDIQNNEKESARFYKIGKEKDKTKERSKKCYLRIAECKENLQDLKGTIEAHTKLTELSPNSVFSFKKLGYLHMQNRNFKEALRYYNEAIIMDPNDAMTYNNRGYLNQMEKNYKVAISDYTKALEIDSKYIGAYVNRGLTEMELNNFSSAKKDFEASVKLDLNSGELRRFLAIAKLKLNDKNGACKDLELAKSLGDNQVDELISQNCK
jgi:tetratricopeptide (TPR) repeat protein